MGEKREQKNGVGENDVLQEEEGKIIKRRDVSERSEENIKKERADGRGLSIGALVNR